MLDDPDKRLAELRAINAEKKLLRAKNDFERLAADAMHREALLQLERLRAGERG